MNSEKYFDKFNIMIIGDEKVGKSSILERYFTKKFSEDRKQTLGVECYDKTKIFGNKKFLIKIWDTAGQEKFAVLAKSYYQRAHGIVLTCAINNRKSFYNLKNWLNSIKDNAGEDSVQLIILANKTDLSNEREVSTEEIEKKAKELNVEYFETSAKMNTNIDEAFDNIIDKVFKNVYQKPKGFDINNNADGNSTSISRCC